MGILWAVSKVELRSTRQLLLSRACLRLPLAVEDDDVLMNTLRLLVEDTWFCSLCREGLL
jgi:hypothetical protein